MSSTTGRNTSASPANHPAPEPVTTAAAGADGPPLKAPDRVPPLAIAAMITTVVLWASAFVGIRAVGPTFSPGSLTLGRLAVAAVVLGLVVLPTLRVLPKGREWWPILAYGVMWFGGYNVALNALGSGQRSTADVAGVLLCLLAAVLAAVSVIIQKPVLKKFPAGQATWFGIMVGAVCCLPFSGQLVSELQHAELSATLGLLYLGVFPTAIAFTTWAYTLSLIDAGKLAATTYLVPGTTILISWLVLGEVPTIWGLAGGILCLIGVGLTRRRSRPRGQGKPAVKVPD